MANKTQEEIYEYVLNYKNDLKDNYNDDQEKFFESSNKLKIQLSNQLIIFSSLLISIGAGYLLSNDITNTTAKNLIVVAIFCFAISASFGFYNTHSASEFHLRWARNAHKKGGLVYKDNSKTVEKLQILLTKLGEKDAELLGSNSKFPSYAQTTIFVLAMVLVLAAMCFVAYQ